MVLDGRTWVSDTTVVLCTYFHWISGSIVIVAKLTFKHHFFIIKFSYNYDIAAYSVKIKLDLR